MEESKKISPKNIFRNLEATRHFKEIFESHHDPDKMVERLSKIKVQKNRDDRHKQKMLDTGL